MYPPISLIFSNILFVCICICDHRFLSLRVSVCVCVCVCVCVRACVRAYVRTYVKPSEGGVYVTSPDLEVVWEEGGRGFGGGVQNTRPTAVVNS